VISFQFGDIFVEFFLFESLLHHFCLESSVISLSEWKDYTHLTDHIGLFEIQFLHILELRRLQEKENHRVEIHMYFCECDKLAVAIFRVENFMQHLSKFCYLRFLFFFFFISISPHKIIQFRLHFISTCCNNDTRKNYQSRVEITEQSIACFEDVTEYFYLL